MYPACVIGSRAVALMGVAAALARIRRPPHWIAHGRPRKCGNLTDLSSGYPTMNPPTGHCLIVTT